MNCGSVGQMQCCCDCLYSLCYVYFRETLASEHTQQRVGRLYVFYICVTFRGLVTCVMSAKELVNINKKQLILLQSFRTHWVSRYQINHSNQSFNATHISYPIVIP